MTNFSDISADPLYLTALASLGTSVPAKLTAAPANNSIAVLPFMNMSDEQGQEHFTDGLTEDIITDLSNVSGFFVIARNSTFAYKGKPTDVRQIAHDLGVKYILEGSARRSTKLLHIWQPTQIGVLNFGWIRGPSNGKKTSDFGTMLTALLGFQSNPALVSTLGR